MQAGEQGLSFEQAQSEWSNRNTSADASGTGAAAETEGDKSDTEKYLRRLEEIGYLPAEQAKTEIAAHDGAAVLLPFSSHEISNLLSSGKNCVLGRGITLKGFIQNAIKSKGQAGRLYLGKLPPKTIDAVRVNTGLDVSGFCSIANASEIWHAFKNHFNETRESNRGNIAITVEDIELFPEILVAPDSITLLPTQDGSGRNAIVFTKRFGNDYVTVQGYSNKKKALVFDTMWIKKGTSTTRSTVDQSKDQEQTSETKRGYGAHE